ncbi:MAG: sortase [Candidatus Heimdallarchaeaceae archaeon]
MSERTEKIVRLVLKGGIILSGLAFALIYGPILLLGIKYRLNRQDYARSNELISIEYLEEESADVPSEVSADIEYIKTLNTEGKFGIVIPSIGVRAFVKENVSPYDKSEYMLALENAVAHAEGTKLPGEGGKIFIFAHSAMNFYKMTTQNIDFYLINDMKLDDKVVLTFEGKVYIYKVIESKFVSPNNLNELESPSDSEVLLLMTCWPPGVDLKRLIVTAELLP